MSQTVAAEKAVGAIKNQRTGQGLGVPRTMFYENKYKNDHTDPLFYQGIEAKVKYD